MRWLRIGLAALVSIPVLLAARPALAQPYARYDVPDSTLASVLAASRSEYENAWNALLVAELRATLARADSASRLARLSRRVAGAEPSALGSRIGQDALGLRARWSPVQRRTRVRAAVSESLATAARAARDYAVADAHYRSALADYRALGEKRREAWVVGGMAAGALLARQLARAESLYREALVLRRRLGDPRLLGNTLNDLGQVYYQLGRLEEAHAHLEEAYSVRTSTGQRAASWNTLSFLGLTLAGLGKPDSAERCFDEALEITTSQGDSARTFDVLANLTTLLMDQDDPRALPVSERALAIARTREDVVREARMHHNLADYLRRNGRYSEAIDRYRLAIQLRQDDPPSLAVSLNGLGGTLQQVGDPERARRYLARALALADSLDNPSIRSSVLVTQSLVLNDLGDQSEARRHAARALDDAVAAGDSGRVHDACEALGELAVTSRDLAAAERWRERTRDAGQHLDPERRAADLVNLALVRHQQGRLGEAERDYREAIDLARSTGSVEVAVWGITNLGDIAERRGDFSSALARYGEAAAMIDTARVHQGERESITLYARGLVVHEAMIHLFSKLDALHPDSGYAERAYALAERARARSLLDRLSATGSHPVAPTIGLKEAQGLLRSDRDALLEYSVGDSSTSLWVIRREGWEHVVLPGRDALRAKIQALRRGLANPDAARSPATRSAQYELYRLLVAPAETRLRGAERIVIVPDGILALIPFEALLTRRAEGDPAARDYLVQRYAMSYAPSASALAARAAAAAGTRIVALGDPWFGSSGSASGGVPISAAGSGEAGAAAEAPDADALAVTLAPLPSSAEEVASLEALAGRRKVEALIGREATRERLMSALPGAGLVHIATHGDVNEAEPERSGLWLAASDSSGPGRLEAQDILAMRTDAALVTLSACESGLGRLERGEGVVGLARAFLAGGARSVIVSLWEVNDRSTAELMKRFYGLALDGKRTRVQALAEAKRALLARDETRSPYYWAPFILIGETGKLE